MDNTKILEILHSLDPDFSDTEKLPPASAEKIRTAFRDAEMALNTFRKTCFNLIGVAQNEPIDGRLAADFRTNVIDSAIDETALKVAEKMNEPPHRVSSGTGNENIIFKIFTDELLSRGSVWENTTKNGDNATFNIVFGEQITHVTGQIRTQWEKTIRNQPILKVLPTPVPAGSPELFKVEIIRSNLAKTPECECGVFHTDTMEKDVLELSGKLFSPVNAMCVGKNLGAIQGMLFGSGISSDTQKQQIRDSLRKELTAAVNSLENGNAPAENEIIRKRIQNLILIGMFNVFEETLEKTENALSSLWKSTEELFRS